MAAAGQVSSPSRPLPLYYAVSQAGRALLAAHASDWKVHGHGLALGTPQPSLLSTTVEPKGEGLFQAVATTTNSGPLSAPVALAALWAALPDLALTPLPTEYVVPHALFVRYEPQSHGPLLTLSRDVLAVIALDRVDATPREALTTNDIAGQLGAYPAAVGFEVKTTDSGLPIRRETPFGRGVLGAWRIEDENAGSNESDRLGKIDEIAPQYRFWGERWLLPSFSSGDLLTPLMLWWSLLYSFSMLARYEPGDWTKALALDTSRLAVPLEDALEEALRALPHLIWEALAEEPLLLPRPS